MTSKIEIVHGGLFCYSVCCFCDNCFHGNTPTGSCMGDGILHMWSTAGECGVCVHTYMYMYIVYTCTHTYMLIQNPRLFSASWDYLLVRSTYLHVHTLGH